VTTPDAAVDVINQRFGRHPGARALHAKGTVCRGTFTPSPAAGRLSRAALLQDGPVPATVRFSNGAGNPEDPDWAPDVRGLAVKLQAPDGERWDISAQSVPRIPTRTVDAFLEFLQASEPGPPLLWRLPYFIVRNPAAAARIPGNLKALRPPASYATVRYYAVHAFRWIDADGRARFVRYRWRPEAGEAALGLRAAREKGRDYLKDELASRLAREPIRFTLEVQVAREGDPTDDPTAQWPGDREVVDAGLLEVTGLDDSRERDGDVLVFDPTRVVDGIELSDDPVLRFRTHAYSASIERRSGVSRGADAPELPPVSGGTP
jgi:catalase